MTLTIEIDERLAGLLQQTANTRDLTADELAGRLLEDALREIDDEEWSRLNRRRIELIRQSHREGLSDEESAELQTLQDAADLRLEECDDELLEQQASFRAQVEQLPVN